LDFNLGSPLEPSDVISRNSLHDTLVDSVYFGYEKLKEGIRQTVYNDRGLDLPELSLFNPGSSSTSPVTRGMDKIQLHAGDRPAHNSYATTSGSEGGGLRKMLFVENDYSPRIETPHGSEPLFKPGTRGLDGKFEITSGGREREYTLHVPPGYDGRKPMPLVVMLHGLSQDSDEIADLTKMSEKADREGFIVAYPNATKWLGLSAIRAWDVDNGVQLPFTDSNDVQFIKDMVGTIKKNLRVDDNRVFAAGFSNGGMMTYKLASEMSDTFSAVAVVSGGASGNEVKPAQSVSVMAVHGTRDHVVPYFGLSLGSALVSLGVPKFESFRKSFRQWTDNVGITDPPVLDKGDGLITRRSYDPKTGTEVIAYGIKGGTHEWPGSDRSKEDRPNSNEAKFAATDRIWEFFKAHPRKSIQFVPTEQAVLSA